MRLDLSSLFPFAPLPSGARKATAPAEVEGGLKAYATAPITVSAAAEAAQPLVINEVLLSTTGDPDSEYVELFGAPGTSLDGLSFIRIEGEDDGQIGDISFRIDFGADDAIGENGFFLAANATAAATYGVTPDITFSASLENGTSTFALVETSSLTGDRATGDETVIDAVGVLNPSGPPENDTFFYDAPVLGPDGGGFLPAGVGRVEDGVDTGQASDFDFLNFFNDSPPNTPTPGTSDGTGGGGGDPVTIDSDPTLVSAIQGSGDASPLVGQTVVIEAIVSGDFQNGDADESRNLGGFFVMEEVADRDGDAATSEGLFIYEGSGGTALDVSEGDRVRVLGTVVERFGKTALEVTEVRVEEAGAVEDVLTLAVLTDLPDVEGREALESMLLTIAEPLTFSESFDYEDFQQATFTSGGPVYQYTQLSDPDPAGYAAYQAEVADRSILIEDGTGGRRGDFDPILEPDGDPFADPASARMGQTLTGLTAIMDYDFGAFRLRLPQSEEFDLEEEANPFPATPADVGSGYVVGSLNVLNYFTTLDGRTDIGQSPRGAESQEELDRQTAKLVSIIEGMDADVIGLTEIENDFAGDGFALQTLVFELNASAGFSQWDFVDPGQEFVGDDAIAVAFIYDTTTTRLIGDAAILDTPEFLDPLGDATSGDSYNRAALAQTFEDIESGGVFTASVNHFKSKGSPTGAEADEDQGDGAGRNDATRTEAARLLAEWLATDPTGSGDEDVLILGDLNAYAQENPIQALEAAGYTDLAAKYEGEDVYSYRFSGQIGTLDYALANEALEAQVTGATTWNVNADTPVFFDYNLDDTFTGPNILRPTDQGLFDGSDPSASSDHDPVLVGLDLDRDTLILVEGTARNDRLTGTDAAERIVSGGGRADFAAGLGGADTFVFTDTDGRKDKLFVTDFDVAEDTLDLDGAAIVEVKETGFGLRLTLDEDRDTIFLFGVDDIGDVDITGDMPFV